ncbi:methyl-accepting chemotaxis protein [Aliivibrio fischeri]|uniref:methyl-accepting chemotaxis protein n=1 Tax=Aliivibrio fischeri TaxID=668 RepID=UPI0012DAC8F9|nr:methyl-accepting chemotaxis protein [Aliivibrio fischeri]MUK65981.1 HAMP domain-containing protein [Aliivibrio fischeri]
MSVITFKPWERLVTDIKLVPKLVMLMVFSTILLVTKQLWDANTFYQSVITIQKERAQESAMANAELVNRLLNYNAEGKELAAEAITIQAKGWKDGNYIYVIDRDSGKVFGHQSAKSLSSLTQSLDDGGSLQKVFEQLTSNKTYSLLDHTRYESAVKVPDHNWVVVASQSASVAEQYYQDYLTQVIWQTLAMIVSFMVILLGASSIMLRQMKYLNTSMKQIAEQNLSEPVEMNCKDEFGDLARELNKTRLQLKSVVETQLSASQELAGLTEIMTISMEGTKEAAQEEFAEIDQLATAMSEMNSTVQNVAENARNASIGTEQAQSQAKIGQEFVEGTIVKIQALSGDIAASAEVVNQVEERVVSISSVVETIRGISEQTNLLALNAAIEAARAGDAGRGFAVVADEVRNLAQSTQGATVEIQDMITQLQNSANQAVELMEKSVVEAAEGVELVTNAGSELDRIVEQVNKINEMNVQIASAADQQSSVAEEMDQNLTNVRELVDASVVVMTELTETSEEMQKNAEELESKMKVFKI